MNNLFKALVYDNQVSLSVLETTDMVNDAIKIHNLDDKSAEILGGLLTACTYMAGCLKNEIGAVSLTVKSGDGSATASVSGDMQGRIRGYIEGGEGGLKGGTLTVIKDDGLYRPFVGATELTSDSVSENLMQYYTHSEQIDTAVSIGVKVEKGKCVAAGGVVMQLLPGTSPENMERAENAMQRFVSPAELIARFGAEGIISEFFPFLEKRGGLYRTFPEYKCNCSRKKIEGVILSLGKDELLSILKERGEVSVHCHYCNTDHVFTESDISGLLK